MKNTNKNYTGLNRYWKNEKDVYLVMWKSPKSEATLSEIKRTEYGLDRLLRTLTFLGVPKSDIKVSVIPKQYKNGGNR